MKNIHKIESMKQAIENNNIALFRSICLWSREPYQNAKRQGYSKSNIES
jgi:hypothetical protein